MSASDDQVTEYAVAAPVRARLMAALLLVVGVVLLVVSILVFLLDLPRDVLSALVILVLVAVVGGGYAVTRRTWLFRADPVGYRVRMVRGAGVRQARWHDVHDVVTTTVHGARCVVLRLQDGTSTTIPVSVLALDADAFARAVRGHLDAAHGYHRR
ncbi:hypothetical protein [Marmoricola endophyticus]|uniref:hypothetical protein n=1 Tax=Marmoricola endophyticus TaxID=2040280 RepID=UPI00166B036B|nr:hypothetical protein [Marmoricola endophyticus]